jgi:hypothetical protein
MLQGIPCWARTSVEAVVTIATAKAPARRSVRTAQLPVTIVQKLPKPMMFLLR